MAEERETMGGDSKADAAEIARWLENKDYVPVLSTQEGRDYFYAVRQGASEEQARRFVKEKVAERATANAAPRFVVHSMVRRQKTRTARVKSPTRHRFKQYLFHDPNKRLIRNRPLTISEEELKDNIEHLRERHEQGMIEVRTPDGRIVDLQSLKAGPARVQSPDPSFPLDSVEQDKNMGIDYPQYSGGAGHKDPAADRAAERIAASKRTDEEPPVAADPSATPSVDAEAAITTSVGDAEPQPADFVDPAATRAASEEVQGEEHGDQDDQEHTEEAAAAGADEDAASEEEQPTQEVTKRSHHAHPHAHPKKKGGRK